MDREATIAFARDYDPQPYHLDDAAAAASPVFGRLSASGWHTAVMAQMLIGEFTKAAGLVPLAGGGIDNVRWIKPVFPPALLSVELEIAAVRASSSRPERGVMTMRTLVRDQDELLCEIIMTAIFLR